MRIRSAPPRSANFAEMPVPAPAPRTGRPAATSARSRATTSALVYIAFLSELGDVDGDAPGEGRLVGADAGRGPRRRPADVDPRLAEPEGGADEVVDEVGVGTAVLGPPGLHGAVGPRRHRHLAQVRHERGVEVAGE